MGKSSDKKSSKGKESAHAGKEKGGETSKASRERKGSNEKGGKSGHHKTDASAVDMVNASPVEEERFISVTVETLRNIKTRIPGREITIHVEDVGEFEYDSPTIELKETETPLHWHFEFPCFPTKPRGLDDLAANPLLFTLFELVHKEKGTKDKDKGGKEKEKKESKTSHEILKEENVIGNCTLDLLPFLLGETRVRQVLLVEQDFDAYGHEVMTWPNLPQLTVCATIEQPLVSAQEVTESNVLFVTLESLYNPTAAMTEEMNYQAATGLPVEYNRSRDVIFDMGLWTEERDVDKMKRWIGFADVGGRGAYSSYRLERDVKSLKNNLKVDLEKKMNQEAPRIEWNTLRRCWLSSAENECMHTYISTNRWWPLEILIEDKSGDEAESKGKLLREPLDPATSIHLAAYFDVSPLLYPGVTKARAISQVYTFCQEDMLARCGINRSLYSPAPEIDPSMEIQTSSSNLNKKKDKQKVAEKSSSKEANKHSASKVAEKTSSKAAAGKKPSLKEKTSSKTTAKESLSGSKIGNKTSLKSKPSKSSKGTGKDEAHTTSSEISPGIKDEFSSPLYNDEGQPVFILFELQLLKPFRAKRPVEEAVKNVDEIVQEGRGKLPPRVMTPPLAETHFKDCIESIGCQITTEYQNFIDTQGGVEDKDVCADSEQQEKFYKYLQDNGFYQSIKETMRNKITDLVREKMGYGFDIEDPREIQTFISDVFVYLMEQVHTIINGMMEAGATATIPPFATNDDLYFFAKEACEQRRYDTAERIFESLINQDKESPVWWLEYAVYHMGLSNWSHAAQLVLEALSLDARNKLALLLYALLMSQMGEEKTAFVFFDALTSIYPRFTQGWLAFHLYNLKTKRHNGAVATLQYAEKCNSSLGKDTIIAPVIDTEPIAWCSTAFPPTHSIFLQAAVMLLKLNVTFYAELALAQELMCDGRSLEYAYYLGVCHYLEGRYADALVHLDEALVGHRKQMSLWTLSGHCYFRLEDREHALENYKFIVESAGDKEESSVDLHMITLRLAEFSLEAGEYAAAKLHFLTAVKYRSTPRCWLGAAVACYLMNEFFEAEKALVEANLLDNSCPVIWAYLALVNLHFHRQTEFEQCYCQAMKSDLHDEELLKRIHALRDSLGYPEPCPLHSRKEPFSYPKPCPLQPSTDPRSYPDPCLLKSSTDPLSYPEPCPLQSAKDPLSKTESGLLLM